MLLKHMTKKPEFVPIPYDEKRKLLKDFQDDIKPLIQLNFKQNIDKALEPIKKALTIQAQDIIAQNLKHTNLMDKNLTETIQSINKFKLDIKAEVENEIKLIIAKVNRSKSDNDIRFNKINQEIDVIE